MERLRADKGKILPTITENGTHNYERVIQDAAVAFIPASAGTNLVIVGDLHGDFSSFRKIIDDNKFIEDMESDKPSQVLVIEGDYLDRGFKEIELMEALLELKRRYPDNVILMKADHEVQIGHVSSQTYHKKAENHYGAKDAYQELLKVLLLQPRPVVAANGVVMAHGGPSYQSLNLQDIAVTSRDKGDKTIFNTFDKTVTWADPVPSDQFDREMSNADEIIGRVKEAIDTATSAGISDDQVIIYQDEEWDLDHLKTAYTKLNQAKAQGFWFNPGRILDGGIELAALSDAVIYSDQGLQNFLKRVGGQVMVRGHQVTDDYDSHGPNPLGNNKLLTIHSTGMGSPDSYYGRNNREKHPSYARFNLKTPITTIDPNQHIVRVWS